MGCLLKVPAFFLIIMVLIKFVSVKKKLREVLPFIIIVSKILLIQCLIELKCFSMFHEQQYHVLE